MLAHFCFSRRQHSCAVLWAMTNVLDYASLVVFSTPIRGQRTNASDHLELASLGHCLSACHYFLVVLVQLAARLCSHFGRNNLRSVILNNAALSQAGGRIEIQTCGMWVQWLSLKRIVHQFVVVILPAFVGFIPNNGEEARRRRKNVGTMPNEFEPIIICSSTVFHSAAISTGPRVIEFGCLLSV